MPNGGAQPRVFRVGLKRQVSHEYDNAKQKPKFPSVRRNRDGSCRLFFLCQEQLYQFVFFHSSID